MAQHSAPPNIDFGHPVIFFDSHPEEQESYLYSYYSSLKATLKIAWTGQVPKELQPGKLRMVWWTVDGTQGMKDYELHQHRLVKDNFHSLLQNCPEVRRCLVTGFSGQNPYAMEMGGVAGRYGDIKSANPYEVVESGMDKKLREEEQSRRYWAEKEAEGKKAEQGPVDVESIIASNEEAENKRLGSLEREEV